MRNKSFTSFAATVFILSSFFVPFLVSAAGATAGTSLNWAGYEATGGTFTSVGASWTVPQSAAPVGTADESLSADATWVGIGGVSSKDLIQAGTQTVFQNGSPSYEAWYEILPSDSQQIPITVHPGDAMTVSISQQPDGLWLISFFNSTTGQNYSTSVSYQSSFSSAEWIEEMPSATHGFVALDNFGTMSFTNGFTVENSTQFTLASADAQPITMINSANQALAVPSSLGGGASFDVTRTSVTASTASIAPIVIIGRGGNGNGNGTGRWTRIGVGVQGYTPPAKDSRAGNAGTTGVQSRYQYFHIGLGNFPAFFRTFKNNFRNGRDR